MDSIIAINHLISENPLDPFLYYILALEEYKALNKEKAIAILEKLIMENPSYLASYYQLGQWYAEQDRPEEAIATWHLGLPIAKEQKEDKTYRELMAAIEALEFE